MRKTYAEIPNHIWEHALDYTGKPEPTPDPKKPELLSEAELDEMVARLNERLEKKELGRKLLEFANTPINERKLPEERQEAVSQLVDSAANTESADDVAETLKKIAQTEKVPADAIWQSANEYLKKEKYEANKERLKFYYPLTADEAAEFLQSGTITNTDDSGNPLKSSLEFTADYVDEDGTWHSGYALDGRNVQRAVTLILDGALLDAEGFNAIGENPHAQKIDLRNCCIGLINEERSDESLMRLRFFTRQGKLALPIYPHCDKDGYDNWTFAFYMASTLRDTRDEAQREMANTEALRTEIYENVNQQEIEEVTRISLDRDRNSSAEALMQLNQDLVNDQEIHQAEQAALDYYSELLDIRETIHIRHYRGNDDAPAASFASKSNGQPSTLWINTAKVNLGKLDSIVKIFSHELWHARQHDFVDRLDSHQLDGQAKRRADLYKYNLTNYVLPELDMEGYERQLIEAEARYFGEQSQKIFMQKYDEAHQPVNRLKRGINRVLGRK